MNLKCGLGKMIWKVQNLIKIQKRVPNNESMEIVFKGEVVPGIKEERF